MHTEKLGDRLIIDANCSWSIEDMRCFMKDVGLIADGQALVNKILYIEQPFNFEI
jgi:L-alanine-DL-glutamate epimerase-like enolase superfamily enzyme